MEDFKPASEKQIALLKKMGIEVFEGITMQEASALINQHKQNEAPKNEVVNTGGNKPAPQTASFSTFMSTVGTKLVANTLQDKERQNQFIANIVSAVSNNKQLAECDQVSVLSAALQAEALKFPINNSLGYVYLVPFNDKKTGMKKAQFQIGYKGYIQLAIRSGLYKDINVCEVREGELASFNPLTGPRYNWIEDYEKRKNAKVIGYSAMLELTSGFHKEIFWRYEAMLDHADEYSQAFNKSDYQRLLRGEIPANEMWKYSSFWYKNFDEMAKKTVLRQLLSKWGIMSVEMQDAYVKDQATLEGERPNYVDSKDFQFNYDEMEQEQDNLNASINVDENGIIQD